jgi:hypothetical protein
VTGGAYFPFNPHIERVAERLLTASQSSRSFGATPATPRGTPACARNTAGACSRLSGCNNYKFCSFISPLETLKIIPA